jgi:PKD repeat protein
MSALDFFVGKIDDNTELRENYTSTGHYGPISGNLNDFFNLYDDFVTNQLNTVSMSWIKITGADTSFNSSLQESAIAIDEPTRTTTYIQQVITPEYAEIDETIVYVDTIPTVAFAVQLQFDSTVVFENYTEPTDGSTRYSWNFGDGSATSNQVHPYHTFPAFDTLFRVCLTATNECGTYTYCDTVYIDSAHWGGNMRIWGEERERETERVRVGGAGIEAILYPNPTEGNTTLQYTLSENATLVITDAQGKLIWQTELNASGQSPSSVIGPPSSNLLTIPSQTFASGIYFYTLQHALGSARGKIVVQR